MKTLTVQQGTPEWAAARATHFCASEAPVVMGASKYATRAELLRQKHTGIAPEVDAHKQALFDRGHAAEAAARAIAEEMIGDTLYPVTAVKDELLASLDGVTMDETLVFEHKLWSEPLAAQVRAGELEPHYYWQLEQQIYVTGAEKVVFVCSDGTREKYVSMEYRAVPGRIEQLLGAWRQFDADLAAYTPPEIVEPVQIVGHSPDQLPALRSSVKGELVLESNIKEWEAAALAYIKSVRDHDLKTDEDFANADAAAKWCDASKTSLQGVRAQLMGATGDVNLAVGTLDRIMSELDKTRIAFNNAIKARKDARKVEIVDGGKLALAAHILALNKRLGKDYMPVLRPEFLDFAGAIRGRSSIAKMQDAVDALLASAKIEANSIADSIDHNLRYLREHAKDYFALFPDTSTIVLKAAEDLQSLVTARIAEHRAAEEKRAAELAAAKAKPEGAVLSPAAQALNEQEGAQRFADHHRGLPVAATPIASPAPASPAANVVPMQRQVAEKPTLTLGEINARLGITMTSAFVRQLGVSGTPCERGVVRYRESEFDLTGEALITNVRTVLARQRKAA